ncbi:MAG: hypothetical protein BGO01_08275 [Armatimonadetes bacterium 55-13]|nr:MAG: hypothetical protein BGO01_08275 [Armatimonadetes bacterium 55-13]
MRLPFVRLVVGSLISGALFALALPPADVWWLAWFAFVPLLLAARGRGFVAGFIGGLVALTSSAICIRAGWFYSLKSFSGLDAWVYTGCLFYGFTVAIVAGAWADKGSEHKPLWWYAAFATMLEACLLVQLPAHLALTQYRQPCLLYMASIGGIWLVSFFLWLANFALARCLSSGKYLLAGVLPVALLGVAGIQKVTVNQKVPQARVGILQSEATDEESLTKLHQKASRLADGGLVVWPEFGGLVLAPRGDTTALQAIASAPGASAIVTSYNDDFAPRPHNVASLISKDSVSAPYYKIHLFGGEITMHTPGSSPVAAPGPSGNVGLSICFDSCFPVLMRETAALPGVTMIALPTIDPPSTHHFIAAVHAAFLPFRAAENGVAMIRDDGYAYSMIVDSDGQIVFEAKDGEVVGAANVTGRRQTMYSKIGDLFLYICIGAWIFGIFLCRKPKATESENLFTENFSGGS